MLDRQVAIFMGQPLLTHMAPTGARELGYLAGVSTRFLAKWRGYDLDTELRRHHAEEGRGTRTVSWWAQFGLQLASAELLTCVHGLDPVLEVVRPLVLLVQSPAAFPEERAYAQSPCLKQLTQLLLDICEFSGSPSEFSGSPSSSHSTVPRHMLVRFHLSTHMWTPEAWSDFSVSVCSADGTGHCPDWQHGFHRSGCTASDRAAQSAWNTPFPQKAMLGCTLHASVVSVERCPGPSSHHLWPSSRFHGH